MIGEKRTLMHCCISLDKILELQMKEDVRVLTDDNGVPLTETELYRFVGEWKAKGYTYFSGECDHLDAEGKCLGHEILEEVKDA
jgi:hypothetical protein